MNKLVESPIGENQEIESLEEIQGGGIGSGCPKLGSCGVYDIFSDEDDKENVVL